MGNVESVYLEKPSLIIFDLNYTLWTAKIRYHQSNPYTKTRDGQVVDADGCPVRYYGDVPDILELLQKEEYKMAITSRTDWPEEDRMLLDLFEFDDYFEFTEINHHHKVEQIRSISEQSGIKYEDMLFFDDSQVNIRTVSDLGVTCTHVNRGMSFEVLKEGLQKYAGVLPEVTLTDSPKLASFQVQHILKSYKMYKRYSKLK